MKSIKGVLKNKTRLIEKKRHRPLEDIVVENLFHIGERLIYEKTNLDVKNIIELFERIQSLLYYLISTYQRKNEICALTIYVDGYFPFRDANMRLKEFFL